MQHVAARALERVWHWLGAAGLPIALWIIGGILVAQFTTYFKNRLAERRVPGAAKA